jgi:hypothetical protein
MEIDMLGRQRRDITEDVHEATECHRGAHLFLELAGQGVGGSFPEVDSATGKPPGPPRRFSHEEDAAAAAGDSVRRDPLSRRHRLDHEITVEGSRPAMPAG